MDFTALKFAGTGDSYGANHIPGVVEGEYVNFLSDSRTRSGNQATLASSRWRTASTIRRHMYYICTKRGLSAGRKEECVLAPRQQPSR